MSITRKAAFFLLIAGLLALAAVPAFAQDATPEPPDVRAVTLTEARINDTFRVSEAPNPRFEGTSVDLQPGQVVITTTYLPVRADAAPVELSATLVPSLVDGLVQWIVVETFVDGQPAEDEFVDQINAAVSASWQRFFRQESEFRYVLDITITETELIYGVATDSLPGEFEFDVDDVTLRLTEEAINDSFRVSERFRDRFDVNGVDLQPGQVVLSAEVTLRDSSFTLTMVVVPIVVEGRIEWQVTSITSDNAQASDALLQQVTRAFESAWRNYVRMQTGARVVLDITITDTDLTITFDRPNASTGS